MKTICVYAGSSKGNQIEFSEQARALGKTLVKNGITLVYGGGKLGLMGELANVVLAKGGNVIGVIPEALVNLEVAHKNLTQLYIVDSMHERKAKMIELSEGFIALPGGLGTFEEFFEVLSWAQLSIHQKPCGLLNTNKYYDPLVQFLNKSVDCDFVKKDHLSLLLLEADPDALIKKFITYRPQKIKKI